MPTFCTRFHLLSTPLCRAFVLFAFTIACCFAAKSTIWAADQSAEDIKGASLPEVMVIGKMDKRTLNHVIHQFIESHAKPSDVIGQVGRWNEDICPTVIGLQEVYAEFVARRIKSVARNVDAPAPLPETKCAENVQVVFTDKPQAQLDFIAKKYPMLLGYSPGNGITNNHIFSRPIQAWYVTGSRQVNGYQPAGGLGGTKPPSQFGPPSELSALSPFTLGLTIDSGSTSGESSEGMGPSGNAGSYLMRGFRSEILHALIIVDNREVTKYSLQSIADYIALLTLTRVASQDSCTVLPSILSLFAKNCSTSPATITAIDTAYLKALYSTDLEMNLNIQQGDIRDRMFRFISSK